MSNGQVYAGLPGGVPFSLSGGGSPFTQIADKWIKPEHKDFVENMAVTAALGGFPGVTQGVFGGMGLGGALGINNPYLSQAITGGATSWLTGGDPMRGAIGGAASYGLQPGQWLPQGMDPTIASAISGGVGSAIQGSNPLIGALTGAAGSYFGGSKNQTPTEVAQPMSNGAGSVRADEGSFLQGMAGMDPSLPNSISPTSVNASNPIAFFNDRNNGLSTVTHQPSNQSGFQTTVPAANLPQGYNVGDTFGSPQAATAQIGSKDFSVGNAPSAPTANAIKPQATGAGGKGTRWWDDTVTNAQEMFSGDNIWPTLLNAGLGYMGGGMEGALSGLALQALPNSGPGTQNNNLLAAIRGDLTSRQRGMGGGAGAMLAGVAGEEWDKYSDPTRFRGKDLAEFGKKPVVDPKTGSIGYQTPFKDQYGRELPGWARGAVGGTIDAIGNQYDPMTGAIVGGAKGSLGANAPEWLSGSIDFLGDSAVANSYIAGQQPAQAAPVGGVANGTTTTSTDGDAFSALERLMQAADDRIDKGRAGAIENIADEMQRRGVRTSGIHQGALTEMETSVADMRQTVYNENVLAVYDRLSATEQAELSRNHEWNMLMAQMAAAERAGDKARANELLNLAGQLMGSILNKDKAVV